LGKFFKQKTEIKRLTNEISTGVGEKKRNNCYPRYVENQSCFGHRSAGWRTAAAFLTSGGRLLLVNLRPQGAKAVTTK
jgi:hypothetical protein